MDEFKRGGEPRLFFPRLEPVYQRLSGLAYPLIRVAAGAILVPHGWRKLSDPTALKSLVEMLHKVGLEPAGALAWSVGSLEFFGGLLLMVGLLTRPVALLIAAEMAVITFKVLWPNGFFVGARGYEHNLLWGLLACAIACRGGGRWSIDRLLGKEF